MLSGRKIMHKPPALKSAQQGVVLIEAMVAILIFSLGVLAIVGLQASMIKNVADSKYRSEASYIAQSRLGLIWADPANAATYVEANTDISTLLPGGTRTVVAGPGTNQYTVTVNWLVPGPNQTTHNYTTTAFVAGG
jgi:type IV pilus assembly protein PilV